MARALKKRWFLCGVNGTDWDTEILAETRSKARYLYWLRVTDAWSEVPLTDVRVVSLQRPPVYEIPHRPSPPRRKSRRMSRESWMALGTRLFGPNPNRWRFVCASCGRTQTMQDFVDAGMTPEQAESRVHFSCLGRWVKSNRCDWTLGGLLQIHSLEVIDDEGKARACFDFDEPPCSVCEKHDCQHLDPVIDHDERPADAKPRELSIVTAPA